ncbi:MAG: camphor resistance protein CrcB [Caulobacterales bacterium 68-7]|nr:fluoride efflux transporter CrcB [Caulobacterales bacterium]OJU11624.1 MAG: camphor resistance protein CrcB [Caulobacterales bacterium 68-7]
MNWLLVAIGGALGSMARYGVGIQATRLLGARWPFGTLTVNIVGGLLMGFLAAWLAHAMPLGQERWRVTLGVGVLGGFTTFSAFSLETALMIERRAYGEAGLYVVLSVVASVTALFVGMLLARRVFA